MFDMFIRGHYIEFPLKYFKPEKLMHVITKYHPGWMDVHAAQTPSLNTPKFNKGGNGHMIFRNLLEIFYNDSVVVLHTDNDNLLYVSPLQNHCIEFKLESPMVLKSCKHTSSIINESHISESIPFVVVENYTYGNSDKVFTETRKFSQKKFDLTSNKIILNGVTFIKDCMYLISNRGHESSHAIAGISCKNKKYLYNGWTTYTQDNAMGKTKGRNPIMTPCKLMPMKWGELNDDVCIDLKNCDMPKVKDVIGRHINKGLCFNPKVGTQFVIYVRKDVYMRKVKFAPPKLNTNRVRKCPDLYEEDKTYRTCVLAASKPSGVKRLIQNNKQVLKTSKQVPTKLNVSSKVNKLSVSSKQTSIKSSIKRVSNRNKTDAEPKSPQLKTILKKLVCPSLKELSLKSGKCVNVCSPNQTRNPVTGRCKKLNEKDQNKI
jgi:hypothetical protein